MSSRNSSLRVLIIDNDAQMRSMVGTVLSAIGVRKIEQAQNGAEGLGAVRSWKPDVIFVDYDMPTMDGIEFTRVLRGGQGPERFLPLIMLTAHSDGVRLKMARDAGISEFVAKPVNAKTIVDRLRSAIISPRPFVSSPGFFGPDRRRRAKSDYSGPFRRTADPRPALEL